MTREEAINDLKDFIDTYITCHGEEDTIAVSLDNVDVEAFSMAIKALEQEPRKGHWIKGYTFPDGEYWKCDKCNELIKVKYPMHYCNNCGSDNSEVEE
jgi:Zn finger protein HypA/HybF involved in hydrogenase expression